MEHVVNKILKKYIHTYIHTFIHTYISSVEKTTKMAVNRMILVTDFSNAKYCCCGSTQ